LTKFTECPICEVRVKPENLASHLTRIHPRAKIDLDRMGEVLGPEDRGERRTAPISPFGIIMAVVIALIIVLSLFLVLTTQPETDGGIDVGTTGYIFTLPIAGGGGAEYSLPNPPGRYVLLEFMHPRCGGCQMFAETENLPAAHQELGTRVEFVSIATRLARLGEWTEQEILDFRAAYQHDWTYLMDSDGLVAAKYGYRGTPYLVLLDSSGKVVWTQFGGMTGDELIRVISGYLP
jgi:thioredoxin-related protein